MWGEEALENYAGSFYVREGGMDHLGKDVSSPGFPLCKCCYFLVLKERTACIYFQYKKHFFQLQVKQKSF